MFKHKKGYTLIEVILSLAIIGLIGTLMVGSIGNLLRSQRASKHHNQAVWLAQDALEITYNLFQTDFNNFPEACTTCYVRLAGGNWEVINGVGPDLLTRFNRNIEIKRLYRNLAGDLAESGATLEPAARHIKVTVSWQENGPKEIALEADFINWKEVTP